MSSLPLGEQPRDDTDGAAAGPSAPPPLPIDRNTILEALGTAKSHFASLSRLEQESQFAARQMGRLTAETRALQRERCRLEAEGYRQQTEALSREPIMSWRQFVVVLLLVSAFNWHVIWNLALLALE